MKRFTLLSISVLCLALSVLVGFHLGSQSVEAQAPGTVVASFNIHDHYVMLDNGDVYYRQAGFVEVEGWSVPQYKEDYPSFQLNYVGNFWSGTPVPTNSGTWGQIKALHDGGK